MLGVKKVLGFGVPGFPGLGFGRLWGAWGLEGLGLGSGRFRGFRGFTGLGHGSQGLIGNINSVRVVLPAGPSKP